MSVAPSLPFGLRLRRRRLAAGMTQEELAAAASVSVRAISDLERGLRHPRRDTLHLLLDALGVQEEERVELESAWRATAQQGMNVADGPREGVVGSFLGAIPPGPLIGRHQELSRILTGLGAVTRGEGRLILLAGEPGVGKTRLTQEVAREGQSRGFLVASGRCYEQEQAVPFYPFLEALATAYAGAPPDLQKDVPGRWPYVMRLLPDHFGHAPLPSVDSSSSGQEEQQRLFRGAGSLLQAIAAQQPVAILLDDLHWSDSASLKLLLHLARHTRGHRVLLFGTYRDVDVNRTHPLERALVDLNRERLVDRLAIRRLGREDTAALIGAVLGDGQEQDDLTTLIYQNTSGNPFFIQEVLRALVERGDLRQTHEGWILRSVDEIRPPDSVRAAVGERLARLRPDSQTLLYEASVLGETFSFDDLQAMRGLPEEKVEAALDEAVAAGLLRAAGRDDFIFNHALTWQTLYADLLPRRRRKLHLAAAQALERSAGGSSPERMRSAELAWHLEQGEETARAVPYALMAGNQAEAGFAYREAEQYYRTALDLMSRLKSAGSPPGETEQEADVLARLGRVLDITEQFDEALRVLERAAALYRQRGNLPAEGFVTTEIGWVHQQRGSAEEGIRLIEPLARALEQETMSPLILQARAALCTALARLYFGLGRLHDELNAAERAMSLGRDAEYPVLLAVATARQGAALMAMGRRAEAQRALEEAVTLAESLDELGVASVALDNLGEIARDGGRLTDSLRYLEQSLDLAEQAGLHSRQAWVLTEIGRTELLLGRWGTARKRFEQAAPLIDQGDTTGAVGYILVHLAELALLRGDWTEAGHRLTRILVTADSRRQLCLVRRVSRLLAARDLLEGRPQAALDRLRPLLDRPGLEEPQVTRLLPIVAQAEVALGREQDAEQTITTCLCRARAQDHRVAETNAFRVLAMLRSRQGRLQDACDACLQSISLAQSMSAPYLEARARLDYGLIAADSSNHDQAREHLQTALVISQQLGARPLIARTEAALSAL